MEPFFRGASYEERWDDMETAYLAYAYPTCGWNNPDTLPLMLLQSLMGESDKGKYDQRYSPNSTVFDMWDEDLAIHSDAWKEPSNAPQMERYMAFNTIYSDCGLFGFYGEAHPYTVQALVYITRSNLSKYGYM